MSKNGYVYAHYIPGSDVPFYIGKGSKKRAYNISKRNRSKEWMDIYLKHGREVKFLYENLSEEEALKKEKEMIIHYGRIWDNSGPLVNKLRGGNGGLIGVGGHNISPEGRKRLSDLMRQRMTTGDLSKIDWKSVHKSRKNGYTRSNEQIEVYAENMRRNWQNPEFRRKNLEARRNSRKFRTSALIKIEKMNKALQQNRLKISEEKTTFQESVKQREWGRYDGLYDANGTFYGPIGNLKEFCNQHNLSYYCVRDLFRGRQKQHRGWQLTKPLQDKENNT